MYRLIVLLILCLFLIPSNAYASDNVTVGLNTYVYVRGGGGGGGGFDNGDPFVYVPPDWAKIFPSMISSQETHGSSFTPPPERPVIIPPVVGNPPQYLESTPVPTVAGVETSEQNILIFIGILILVIGVIAWFLIPEQRVK